MEGVSNLGSHSRLRFPPCTTLNTAREDSSWSADTVYYQEECIIREVLYFQGGCIIREDELSGRL